jgi:hypothetical protein
MVNEMNDAAPKILLIYWGRKGAGGKLMSTLGLQLKQLGFDVYLSIGDVNELEQILLTEFPDRVSIISIGSKLNLLLPWRFLTARNVLREFIDAKQVSSVVYVMPHPWDLGIDLENKPIRIIHDARRHPGDGIWPSTNALRRRILTGDSLIALSNSVENQISKLGAHAQVAAHPTFEFQPANSQYHSSDVLVVGRQRKYK